MTATHASQIIDGYLKRLDSELSGFPPGRRQELNGQIAEHIEQARSELSEETDADLLTILDRLGEPDEIAAAARSSLDMPVAKPGPLEIFALLFIGMGGVLFPTLPIGFIVGTGLVWRSKSWTPREKYRGAYAPLVVTLALLLAGALVSGLFGRQVLIASFFFAAVVANLLIPLGSAIFLAARLGRRLQVLAWVAIAIVALAVYLPAAATFVPARQTAFIGTAGGETGPAPVAGRPGCGGFYGTVGYASNTPLFATAPVSVGLCWDGTHVTKTWGPDCSPEGGPGLRVNVQGCTVQDVGDGSLIITISSSATALTAPFFTQMGEVAWRITPDGRVMQI